MRISHIPLILAVLAIASDCANGAARGSDSADDAFSKVKAGLESFSKGDFAAAAREFEQAEQVKPDNLRIAFDRGCAAAAAGEFDKAVEQFRKSSGGRDRSLAALSHVNLGAVAVSRANKALGEHPEQAVGEVRDQARDGLKSAIQHYREALRIDSEQVETRSNLEMLRLWLRNMELRWNEEDRKREFDKLDPLAMIDKLESQQRSLRSSARMLNNGKSTSNSAISLAERQKALADDCTLLQNKLESMLTQPAQPAQNGSPDDRQHALQEVKEAIGKIQASMTDASKSLASNKDDVLSKQNEAIDGIARLDFGLRQFPQVLEKSIKRQEELLKQSQAQQAKVDSSLDWEEKSDEQLWIDKSAQVLKLQAEAMLKSAGPKPDSKAKPAKPDANSPPGGNPIEALRPALQKGIELSPAISMNAQAAAKFLPPGQFVEAVPKQQKTLDLLREIAKLLPKPPQDQQQNQKDDQKDPKDNKDNKDNKDPKNKGQNQKPDPKDKKEDKDKPQSKDDKQKKDDDKNKSQDQQKKPEPKKDEAEESGSEKERQNKEKDDGSPKRPAKPVDPTRLQIDRLAEKVRDRDKKHKEAKEQLMQIEGRVKVKKDW